MDDYISRGAAVEYLTLNMGWNDENGYPIDDWDERKAIIADRLGGIPAADVKPVVRGRWKWVVGKAYAEDGSYELETPFPYCTNCGKRPLHDETSTFCPYCGADMREKVTEK